MKVIESVFPHDTNDTKENKVEPAMKLFRILNNAYLG